MHMSALSFRFLLWSLALGVLPAAVHGLEFRVLGWAGSVNNLFMSTGPGSKPVPLEAHEDVLSSVHRVNGAEPLRIFAKDPSAVAAGENPIEPIATIALPLDLQRAILVLAANPRPQPGETYVGVWLDDSPEARPDNSIVVHNLSSADVALRVGSDQAVLKRKDRLTHVFSEDDQVVMIQAAIMRGAAAERVMNEPQPVRAGFRIMVILRDGRRQLDGTILALDRVTFYDYRRPAAR